MTKDFVTPSAYEPVESITSVGTGERLDIADLQTAPVHYPAECFKVEERDGKWFAVNAFRRIELAPVFDCRITAEEVGHKCVLGEAFFNRIPTVVYGTPYPRPLDVKATPFRTAREETEIKMKRTAGVRRVVSRRPLG